MSTFHFRDAELISRLALVGIAGQSRSGKTLTALRVAYGIASVTGGQVAAIDTEAGRMLEYGPGAKPFGYSFKYAQFDPPFTGERYLEALLEAEKVVGKDGVIVIDSMSHEHEGEGGVLEQHEDLVQKMGASANMTAWNRAKLGRKKLINYVRSHRKCHLIMCFRAEQKTGVGPNGKPVDLGLRLIGWEGWRFEMSLFLMLNREQRGVELHHDTTAGLDQILPSGQITEETGAALGLWCGTENGNGHKPEPAPGGVTVWLKPGHEIHGMEPRPAFDTLEEWVKAATSEAQLNALVERNPWALDLPANAQRRLSATIDAVRKALAEAEDEAA